MELPVRAPGDGTVKAIHCRAGRSRAARDVSLIESRMSACPPRVTHRRSRPARRPAERGRGDRDGRQDRVRRPSQRRRPLPVIEVSAFVSPKWVPQMADAAEVFAGITRRPGTRYTALVPNLAGLDRAIAAGVDEVAIFAAASETFSRSNINQAIDESLDDLPRPSATRRRRGPSACAPTSRPRSAARSKARSHPRRVAEVSAAPDRDGRLRGRGQRHHRHRASRAGAARRSTPSPARVPLERDRAALPRHARHRARQRADGAAARRRRRSTRPRAASAAARTRPARPATSRPKICSTCWTAGHRDRRQHRQGPRGVALHRTETRPPAGVALRRCSLSDSDAPTANHKDHEGHEDHEDLLGLRSLWPL